MSLEFPKSSSAKDRNGSCFGRFISSPAMGVYCALASAAGSPLHLLTAAMIVDVSAPMVLLVRSLEHLAVFGVISTIEMRRVPSSLIRRELWPLFGHALATALSLATAYYALAFLPSADVYVISCATPIFATLAGYFFLKERFGWAQACSALIVVAGAVIITKPTWLFGEHGYSKDGAWIGTLLSVASCVFSTVQALFVRKLQSTPTGVIILVAALLLSALSAAILILTDDYRYTTCGTQTFLLLAGGGAQIVTNGLVVLAGKLIKVGRLAVIKTSAVLFTYVFQAVLVGVVPTWTSLLGASLILLSVLMTILGKYCGKCSNCKKMATSKSLHDLNRHQSEQKEDEEEMMQLS